MLQVTILAERNCNSLEKEEMKSFVSEADGTRLLKHVQIHKLAIKQNKIQKSL